MTNKKSLLLPLLSMMIVVSLSACRASQKVTPLPSLTPTLPSSPTSLPVTPTPTQEPTPTLAPPTSTLTPKPTTSLVPPTLTPKPAPAAERILFPSGATHTTIEGYLPANGIGHYVLRALAGQRMIVVPHASGGQVDLVISGTDGQVLLSGRVASDGYDGIVPATQDYLITVQGLGETSTDYTLEITIPPL